MDTVTPVIVGLRVKLAREALGLTQERLSGAFGFNDRQTLSDIETGKRLVKDDELLRFSELLDQDLDYFLDPFSIVGEACYSWRAGKGVDDAALQQFERKAAGWVGLLRWLRARSPEPRSPLGFTLRLDERSSFEDAQARAEQLVVQLELGSVPALELARCVEVRLDIPVLFVDMNDPTSPDSISGAACHLSDLGVVLVNRRESAARRNFDLAHELFHILTWERMAPAHRETNALGERRTARNVRVEQLADNFAAALLMPRSSLDAFIDPARDHDVTHLADVAQRLRVSFDALGWRLKSLGRIDEPTRMALQQLRRKDSVADERPRPFSAAFVRELHLALDRGRLTARRAASAMGLSLSELACLFSAHELPDPFRS